MAHLDGDPSNSDPANVAFLCLEHHDEYDGRTSQSKGLTIHEIKRYRSELYESLKDKTSGEMASAGDPPKELWPPGRWTADHDDALEFHTDMHRNQSAVLAVSEGPKTVDEINAVIPPGDKVWTELIVRSVVERGWVQPTAGNPSRYELSPCGHRMLRALREVPEAIKDAAWRRIWSPPDSDSA